MSNAMFSTKFMCQSRRYQLYQWQFGYVLRSNQRQSLAQSQQPSNDYKPYEAMEQGLRNSSYNFCYLQKSVTFVFKLDYTIYWTKLGLLRLVFEELPYRSFHF